MTRLLARWRVFLGFVLAAVVLWLSTTRTAASGRGRSVLSSNDSLTRTR